MIISLENFGLDRNEKIIKIANLKPFFVYQEDKIKNVVDAIVSSGYRRIPILDKKKNLVGIVTTMDILNAFLRRENFNQSISSIMVKEVIFCFESESISDALQKMKISRRGGLPILNKKKNLVGIVTERDFLKNFLNFKLDYPVSEFMTKKPLVISNKVSIYDCLKSIVNSRYRRLPVMDGSSLVGIVTSADLLKYIHSHDFRFDDLNLPIDYVINKNPVSVQASETISEIIKKMVEKDVGGILVFEDKKLKGIITERDILERVV